MAKDWITRKHISELLKGGFAPVVELLREFPYEKSGIVLQGLPFSAWSVLEHMRVRQFHIIDSLQHRDETVLWIKAYWPESNVPENPEIWNNSINLFEIDLENMIKMINDPLREFSTSISAEKEENLHKAAIMILQHNAYHIGQIKVIGRQLGVW